MKRLAPLLAALAITGPLVASCGDDAAPAPAESPGLVPAPVDQPSGQDSPVGRPAAASDETPDGAVQVVEVDPAGDAEPVGGAEPAGGGIFDFVAGSGASTWPEGEEYSPLGGIRLGGWEDLARRVGVADFVVLVDIVSVDDTSINSSENAWWHYPIENRKLPAIDISRRVVVEIVALVKHRQGSYPDRPIDPIATINVAPDLPPPPNIGDQIAMSIPGGHVTLDIPDDAWAAYVTDRNSNLEHDHPEDDHAQETPGPPFGEPNPGTITLAREPGLDLEEGRRYVLILDGMTLTSREGTTEFTWRPTFTFALSQLEVDAATQAFREPDGDVVTAAEFFEAAEAAVARESDPDMATYHIESLKALLGLAFGG